MHGWLLTQIRVTNLDGCSLRKCDVTTDDVHEYVDKCVGIGGGKVYMGGFPHLLMKGGFPHLLMKGGFPQSQSKGGFPHLHMTGGFPHFQHQGVVCHTYFIDMVVFHTYVCSLSFCLNLGRHSRVSTPMSVRTVV